MVARMTELLLDRIPQDGAAPLDSRLSAKVLEVGTGSGYQTAVLCRIFESVYTIERVPFLYERSRVLLEAQGTQNVCHLCADGSLGWPEYAPFDRILVTAGAPDAPAPLLDQLADGAVMIIPVGAPEDQVLTRFERTGSGTRSTPILSCRFVKLIGDAGFHALA
jgi:protein-L-isoaspartate(D-aspartate) O-methyltransferase